jgi:glycosyltransferase involved in cell wall biosynthesis
MYSFVLTTFNDSERAIRSLESLKKTIPEGTDYRIIIVDGGSNPEGFSKLLGFPDSSGIVNVENNSFKHLSHALNTGIDRAISYGADHVFWIHTDCEYHDYDWAGKLCWVYDNLFPLFGRLGPATRNIDNSDPNSSVLRGGNQCPLVFGKQVIKELKDTYGWVYNPNYVNIGGYEDWDCGQRLLKLGYGFGICSLVDVWHEGMGTRKLRDTTADQQYNGSLYNKLWNTWNQPGFEIDLTQIGDQLKLDFEKQYDKVWYK